MGTKSLPGQRHPGGVPWVNSGLWCGGSPVRNPGGTPIFWPLPFRGDRLETKKGARELGLMNITGSFILQHIYIEYLIYCIPRSSHESKQQQDWQYWHVINISYSLGHFFNNNLIKWCGHDRSHYMMIKSLQPLSNHNKLIIDSESKLPSSLWLINHLHGCQVQATGQIFFNCFIFFFFKIEIFKFS